MPPKSNQYWLVSRLQRRHLVDCQRTLLFLPRMLRTPSLAPLHWRYRWINSGSCYKEGFAVGVLQSPRILWHRRKCRSMHIHDHRYLLQFLATGNANYCSVHEL